MRYWIAFTSVLLLAALPLSATAQDAEEGTTPEPSAEEPAPSSESAPEEPALQLELDETGVNVAPSPPRTELEKTELRSRPKTRNATRTRM
jgi:hypothetical protein